MKPDSTSSKHVRAKIQALRQSGTLNPRAQKVQDRLFLEEDFFDPEDLPQVKYEMLRRVQKEAMPIGTAAASFGFSRPSFYKALEDFAREGLVGLIPKKRGPKRGHKLTREIMAFVAQIRAQEPSVRTPDLVQRIRDEFGTQVHRRTLERALIAAKKNRTNPSYGGRAKMVAAGGDAHRALRAAARIRVGTEDCIWSARGPCGVDCSRDGDMDTAYQGTDSTPTIPVACPVMGRDPCTAASAG